MSLSDKEKELILEYVDGEPNQEDTKAVESLIENNEEAAAFKSSLASTRNALILDSERAETRNIVDNLISLIEERQNKKESKGFFGLFGLKTNEGFSFSQIGGGALAGVAFSTAFAVFLAPNTIPSDKANWSNYGFSSSDPIVMNKLNFRGEEQIDSLDSSVKMVISKMIEDRNTNGTLLDGKDSYKIYLQNYFENSNCYQGNIDFNENQRTFLYCDDEIKSIDVLK